MLDTESRCRSCDQLIAWCLTPKGKRMPVDPEPDPDGNVIVWSALGQQRCRVVKTDEHVHGMRYTSHFATCPHADEHRR